MMNIEYKVGFIKYNQSHLTENELDNILDYIDLARDIINDCFVKKGLKLSIEYLSNTNNISFVMINFDGKSYSGIHTGLQELLKWFDKIIMMLANNSNIDEEFIVKSYFSLNPNMSKHNEKMIKFLDAYNKYKLKLVLDIKVENEVKKQKKKLNKI